VFVHAIDPTTPNDVDGLAPRPPIWLNAVIESQGGDLEIDSEQQAIRLPVIVPLAAMPDVISAGYALTPYAAGADYASTSTRARRLWLEFASPPPAGLAIVARVLSYAPDPLLYHDDRLMTAPPPPDPGLPLDPEYVRSIVPGQFPDEDGAEAMQPLIPSSDSPTRFMLPLPVNDEAAPELFGIWTYEFRFARVTKSMPALGYKGPVLWSSAHGRYGRPLRLAGVQHPAPPMPAGAEWVKDPAAGPVLAATAPYATPVRDGQIVGDGAPRSTIVFVLYAQVPQADGSTFRNVMLDHVGSIDNVPFSSGARALGAFTQTQVTAALDALALPRDAGLSVVAIEFLPEGGAAEPEPTAPPGPAGDQPPPPPPVDPLNSEAFGRRRILRASPLTAVGPVCGVLEPAGAPGHGSKVSDENRLPLTVHAGSPRRVLTAINQFFSARRVNL
jgi:hypothetical protein